jgi:hypothetical protein
LADEILTGWIVRYGKGRAIFADDPDGEVIDPQE